jgi:hypothetical protein
MTIDFTRAVKIFLVFAFIVFTLQACESNEDVVVEPEALTTLPFTPFKLDDMSEFQQPKTTKWSIVGNVYADRKKKHHIEKTEGEGVLVNIPTEEDKANIFTKLEHGDMDIELDFMMPNGSNSGIYFQGRYEVQLLDSWMKDSVGFGDCGGIYERWANDKGFEGTAPLSNATKAPGLWQHLFIRFKAPRFDRSGRKITNAIFNEIWLNGTLIQDNIQVSGPTRSAAFEDEKPMGPLMIQGDHGPVAFKNIRYKTFGNDSISLSNIKFSVYKGIFRSYDTLETVKPERTGISDSLSWQVGDKKAQLVLEGNMSVPKEGDYLFKIKSGGASWLLIDGSEVLNNKGTREYTDAYYSRVSLKAGSHPFKIIYANQDESLALEYEGPGIPFRTLTTPASQRLVDKIEPFEYAMAGEPAFQRGFLKVGNKIKPYAIAVGIPGEMNYAYDLSAYTLLSAWRGKYIDVSNMWTDRGETQREIPLGTAVEFVDKPNLVKLSNSSDAWPDTVSVDNNMYSKRGYRIDEKGMPVFMYSYENANVEDYITPSTDKTGFVRTLKANFEGTSENIYYLLASGATIEQLPNGAFAIDDKKYYIESISGIDMKNVQVVKAKNGASNLLLRLPSSSGSTVSFNYSLVW